MAAYRRVYDSRHLRSHTLGNRVWATFTFSFLRLLILTPTRGAAVRDVDLRERRGGFGADVRSARGTGRAFGERRRRFGGFDN